MPSLRQTAGAPTKSVASSIAALLPMGGSRTPDPVAPKSDPWRQAFAYAKSTGLSRSEAQDFADHYATYIEDRANEIRDPDLPLPTPSEFTP